MAIDENSIDPGSYLARPTCWGLTGEDPEKAQFAIEFRINEPESPHANKLITWFGGFNGKGFDFTTKALRTCGWEGSDILNVELNMEADVRVVVAHEEWEGEWRVKCKYVNGPDEQGGRSGFLIEKSAMADDKKQAFAREFAARMRAAQGPAKPAAPTAPAGRTGVPARPGAPARPATSTRTAAPASRPAAGATGQRPGQRTAARPAAPADPIGNPDADDNGQHSDDDIPY